MSVTFGTLAGLLAFWMAACCFCGMYQRFVGFLAVLCAGLAANLCWMVFGLNAHVLEVHVINAQGAATLCALCAYVVGWFMGRIRRAWVESAVTKSEV